MYAFYGQKKRNTIGYVKMYSTIPEKGLELCFRCILMPYSQERGRVHLQSIQFFFSASGDIRRISICYLNLHPEAMAKARASMNVMEYLKGKYNISSQFCRIEEDMNRLSIDGIDGLMPLSFVKDFLMHLKVSYLMSETCINELQSLLLSPECLAKEYRRLRGPGSMQDIPPNTPCAIM